MIEGQEDLVAWLACPHYKKSHDPLMETLHEPVTLQKFRGWKIFEGIIFAVRAKTAKILLLENLSIYGIILGVHFIIKVSGVNTHFALTAVHSYNLQSLPTLIDVQLCVVSFDRTITIPADTPQLLYLACSRLSFWCRRNLRYIV